MERLGVYYAQELLHSYNCLIDEPAGAVILMRDAALPASTRFRVSLTIFLALYFGIIFFHFELNI